MKKPQPFIQNRTEDFSLDDFVAQTTYLLERLSELGLRVNPSSRLEIYNRAVDTAKAILEGKKSLNDINLKIFHQAMIEVPEFNFIIDELSKTPELPNWRTKFQSVLSGKDLPESEYKKSQGRDTQFELLIAATCRKAGFNVILDEPDVIVESPEFKIGMAAKRIKSKKTIQDRVRKASKQIVHAGMTGIICINLNTLLNPRNELIRLAESKEINQSLQKLAYQFLKSNEVRFRADINTDKVFAIMGYISSLCSIGDVQQFGTGTAWSILSLCQPSSHHDNLLYEFTEKLKASL